ncbi:hypothetical protein CYMTET_21703 [Cymbomonas tetramitiformis]|uniref:Uncharacterized protein n=1 Tax=Cymbomonas tetramitiformis TaxID=36881 RepID=A0AAE0G213_9CHLO|nr:hypothetical protein CYMTET_21703 [Cymbomonas tetramitiformis]
MKVETEVEVERVEVAAQEVGMAAEAGVKVERVEAMMEVKGGTEEVLAEEEVEGRGMEGDKEVRAQLVVQVGVMVKGGVDKDCKTQSSVCARHSVALQIIRANCNGLSASL